MKYIYICNNKDCKEYNKEQIIHHSIKQDNVKQCIHCNKETLNKKIEAPAFKLNGIGVYMNGTN